MPRPKMRRANPSRAALLKREQREQARANGICTGCCKRPTSKHRLTCTHCLVRAQVKTTLQRFRKRGTPKPKGSSCYPPGYSIEWVDQVAARFNGVCVYTGWPIEPASTAALDHEIPISRIGRAYSPSRVHHPDNLVWCHHGANAMKADMTGSEFREWLREHLPVAVATLEATDG